MLGKVDPRGTRQAFTDSDVGGGATVITIPPATSKDILVLYALTFSYAVAPTNGNITVALGSQQLLDVAVTAVGPHHWEWVGGLYDEDGRGGDLVITLADGAQTKKLNALVGI